MLRVQAAIGSLLPKKSPLLSRIRRISIVLTGLRFVEVDGEPIGYVMVRWMQEDVGPGSTATCANSAGLDRAEDRDRHAGLGSAATAGDRRRLTISSPRCIEPTPRRILRALAALLERNGYKAIEHSATLVRPDLEDIPEAPLPVGLEIRPVTEDQLRTIFDADIEAFVTTGGLSSRKKEIGCSSCSSPTVTRPSGRSPGMGIESPAKCGVSSTSRERELRPQARLDGVHLDGPGLARQGRSHRPHLREPARAETDGGWRKRPSVCTSRTPMARCGSTRSSGSW